jgi:DNA-binding NarL/FixJ family response regulator
MSRVRVLLVDDQTLFRAGLRTLLSTHPELEIVGEASNGQEALAVAAQTRPDVVLMDLKMPVLDGVSATRRLRVQLPNCRVVALTTFEDDELVFEGLRAGAVGYLLKDAPVARLVEATLAAARGESVLQPSVASKVLARLSRLSEPAPADSGLSARLSEREQEVLRLIARGASNKEIAAALFLAEGTVKNHVTNILTKLEVGDRTQAALRARELGLV